MEPTQRQPFARTCAPRLCVVAPAARPSRLDKSRCLRGPTRPLVLRTGGGHRAALRNHRRRGAPVPERAKHSTRSAQHRLLTSNPTSIRRTACYRNSFSWTVPIRPPPTWQPACYHGALTATMVACLTVGATFPSPARSRTSNSVTFPKRQAAARRGRISHHELHAPAHHHDASRAAEADVY